jgi:hypothetical protein
MAPFRIIAGIALSTFASFAFETALGARAPSTDRPKIGLVLGGGGIAGRTSA